MYRQGDVLVVPVDTLPKERTLIRRKGKNQGVILAAGEATGHHHRVRERGARLYLSGSERYLTTGNEGGTITHEEHDPIDLPPNTVFKVVQQREYKPVIKDNTVRASQAWVRD